MIQQINTHEISGNTEKFVTVRETGKSRKIKLNHQQDYRIPLSNTIETLPIEEFQDKPKPVNEGNSILLSFSHATSKRKQKKKSTKHQKQTEPYITNDQYEEPLEQRKAFIVPVKSTYGLFFDCSKFPIIFFEKKNAVLG